MNIDPSIHLSRAIDAALEAVMVPALILPAVGLVIAATGEMIRVRWRRGGPQAAAAPWATRRGNRARGAEA